MRFITITQEDIDRGRKLSSSWCPIAWALRREFPEARSVTVSPIDWWIQSMSPGQMAPRGSLTPRLQSFIDRFDDGLPVEPGPYMIEEDP